MNPAEKFECFGVVFGTNGKVTCRCPPDRCVASLEGLRLGRVSVISDINCRACAPMNYQTSFPLDADDTHRTETFGPADPGVHQAILKRAKAIDWSEQDPTGRDPHVPGAKLDAGKPRPALVLGGFARALLEVVKVGTYGAVKYTDDGWMEVPNGEARYDDAKLRHWLSEKSGMLVDPESKLKHAAHEAWGALARLELMLRRQEQERIKV